LYSFEVCSDINSPGAVVREKCATFGGIDVYLHPPVWWPLRGHLSRGGSSSSTDEGGVCRGVPEETAAPPSGTGRAGPHPVRPAPSRNTSSPGVTCWRPHLAHDAPLPAGQLAITSFRAYIAHTTGTALAFLVSLWATTLFRAYNAGAMENCGNYILDSIYLLIGPPIG